MEHSTRPPKHQELEYFNRTGIGRRTAQLVISQLLESWGGVVRAEIAGRKAKRQRHLAMLGP
jgi:hypothetical protein